MNHKLITFSVVYLLTSNLSASVVAAAGSVFPDAIEGFDYKSSSWKEKHRKISHWGAFYLLICVILFLFTGGSVLTVGLTDLTGIFEHGKLSFTSAKWLFWFFAGAFMHVLEDAVTGKTSFFHPLKRNFGVKLFRTGSPVEYLISILVFLVFLAKITQEKFLF